MTILPPLPPVPPPPGSPLPYAPPPPPQNPARRALTWAIIVAATVTLFVLQRSAIQRATVRLGNSSAGTSSRPASASTGPTTSPISSAPAPTNIDASIADLTLNAMSRYALGLKALLGDKAGKGMEGLVSKLDEIAITDRQRLRIVIVDGELEGSVAAIKRLDAIGPRLDPASARAASSLRSIYHGGGSPLDSSSRQQLTSTFDWLAPVALTHDQPADSPQRRAALRPAVRGAIAMVVFEIGILFWGLAGLALLVVAIVLASLGHLRSGVLRDQVGSHPALLETAAAFLVMLVLVSLAGRFATWLVGSNLTYVLLLIVPLVFLWPRLRGMSWPDARRQIGWHAGTGVFRELAAGFLGYTAGLPVIFIGILASAVLMRQTGTRAVHPIVFQASHGGWLGALMLYLLAAVWAPLVEESAFRGAFYGGLRRWPAALAAACVAFVFAAIHPQGLGGIPALMGIAIVFALIREWRGSLIGPMFAHAMNNFLLLTLMFLVMS